MKNMIYIKTTIALIVCVMMTTVLRAQTADTTQHFCKVSMTNGTKVTGMLISEDSSHVMISNSALGQITVLKSNVETIEVVEVGNVYSFTMSTGKVYRGTVISQDAHEISLNTSNGNVKLMNSNIADFASGLTDKSEVRFDHGSRYLFAPSAIPLRKGEGYYQNIYILMNGFQYGVTDHVSVGGGVIAPFGFFGTMKYGRQVGDKVHVAAGGMFLGMMMGINTGVACGFGSVTVGDRYTNFTLTTGFGAIMNDYDWYATKRPIINISGMMRVTDNFSLITENYFFPQRQYSPYSNNEVSYTYYPQLSGGFRIGGGHHTFDLAATTVGNIAEGDLFVIPYFSYAYQFQKGKK